MRKNVISERIEGLATTVFLNKLKGYLKFVQNELVEDGFDKEEIMIYLEKLVDDNFSE